MANNLALIAAEILAFSQVLQRKAGKWMTKMPKPSAPENLQHKVTNINAKLKCVKRALNDFYGMFFVLILLVNKT